MKKIILALILVLALLSGINPNITAQDRNKNHDDDDHSGCFFLFDD
jgi:Phr family secreted Rap phosphatase inhibitor